MPCWEAEYAVRAGSSLAYGDNEREIDRLSTNDEQLHSVASDFLEEVRKDGLARVEIRAAAIVDAGGTSVAPGAVEIDTQRGEIIDVRQIPETGGASDESARPGIPVLDLGQTVLMPGLCNAHAHLDLTHVGPVARGEGVAFSAWLESVRQARHTEDGAIEASVQDGVRLSLAGGTVAIGDIAGAANATPRLGPWRVLEASPLWGVSYVEFFAVGTREQAGRERLAAFLEAHAEAFSRHGRMRLGLSPHAPYTVGPGTYAWLLGLAEARDVPLCTHLAESAEEQQFVGAGTGPLRELLESLGLWSEDLGRDYGRGKTAVELLAPVLRAGRIAAVHVNDCPEASLETLASTKTPVIYCPRASAYFHAERTFGPHRYRDMLRAGIPVALGTDSAINLPLASPGGALERISVLDEMRLLFRRDGTDPVTLLAMGTTNAAMILGLDASRFLLSRGSRPIGLVAVPVEGEVGRRDASAVEWLKSAFRADSAPSLLWMWK